MTTKLDKEQVVALAPDPASAKAGAGLASEGKWASLGADAEAVWGECKGSGAKPYQTQVELAALTSRCSCPSRKFPCKHALGLLLLYAQPSPCFAQSPPRPEWVAQWLAGRQEKAAKKEAKKEQAVTERQAQDPAAAAAKREAVRWKRIEAGAGDVSRWIADQFRRGLAQFGREQLSEGRAMAARMVDAQAPGLEQQLLAALAALDAHGAAGAEEAAERLGLMQLLCAGVQRRETLSAPRLADIRAALGWPMDKDDLLASAGADAQADQWEVLGIALDQRDERLTERRVWLRGQGSGRHALLLDFAFRGAGWDSQWLTGVCYPATLRFYPGSAPLRALLESQGKAVAAQGAGDQDAVDLASRWLAVNPWLQRVPMTLNAAFMQPDGAAWALQTPAGRFPLRLENESAWALLAFSGGHALRLMGEWDGRLLLPLTACLQDAPAQRLALGVLR